MNGQSAQLVSPRSHPRADPRRRVEQPDQRHGAHRRARQHHRWWRDDLVSFVLGCSLSFQQALLRTSGPLVVAMRPFKPAEASATWPIRTMVRLWKCAPMNSPSSGPAGSPQAVVESAGVPFCIMHYPGAMLITDLKNAHIAVL